MSNYRVISYEYLTIENYGEGLASRKERKNMDITYRIN